MYFYNVYGVYILHFITERMVLISEVQVRSSTIRILKVLAFIYIFVTY